MNIKFFTMELNNVQELKLAYRDLIKKNHPDVGGCTEDMKQINSEYEHLFKNVHELGQKSMSEEELKKDFNDLNDNFREVVSKIFNLDGVIIEIIGSWVYCTGNTFPHAQAFRDSGFKFSRPKKAWYWYNGLDVTKNYRGRYNLNQVRNMHGSSLVNNDNKQKQLACA